jgi:hypothetical protein
MKYTALINVYLLMIQNTMQVVIGGTLMQLIPDLQGLVLLRSAVKSLTARHTTFGGTCEVLCVMLKASSVVKPLRLGAHCRRVHDIGKKITIEETVRIEPNRRNKPRGFSKFFSAH